LLGSADVILPDDAAKRCIYYPRSRSSDGTPGAATDTDKEAAPPVPPANDHDRGVAADPRREWTQIRKISCSTHEFRDLKRVKKEKLDRIDRWQGARGDNVLHALDNDLACQPETGPT
jgi:hypothetical protein